jgi:hypothetical protein
MKKLSYIIIMAVSIAGCGQATKDSAEKADSTNMTKDSADKKHPASFGQEISGDDAKFAVKAAAGGLPRLNLVNWRKRRAAARRLRNSVR